MLSLRCIYSIAVDRIRFVNSLIAKQAKILIYFILKYSFNPVLIGIDSINAYLANLFSRF